MRQGDNWSLFRLSDRKQFDNVSLETIDFFFRALSEKSRVEWLMWREGFSGWRPFGELSMILTHLQTGDSAPLPPPVPDAILNYANERSDDITKTKTKTKTIVEPVDEIVAEEPSEISVVQEFGEKTHSTVSRRAIQAATEGLRKKTDTSTSLRPSVVVNATPTPTLRSVVEPLEPSMKSFEKALAANDQKPVLNLDDEATLSLMLESQAAVEDRSNVRYPRKFKIRIFTPQGVLAMFTADCSTSGFRLEQPLPTGLPRFFHVEIDLGLEGKIPVICSEIREKDGRAPTRVRIQVNDHVASLKSALVRAA